MIYFIPFIILWHKVRKWVYIWNQFSLLPRFLMSSQVDNFLDEMSSEEDDSDDLSFEDISDLLEDSADSLTFLDAKQLTLGMRDSIEKEETDDLSPNQGGFSWDLIILQKKGLNIWPYNSFCDYSVLCYTPPAQSVHFFKMVLSDIYHFVKMVPCMQMVIFK